MMRSHGRKTVQDVLKQLFAARAQGAVDEFQASVIEGSTTIVPPANAFGPCLTRVTVSMTVARTGEKRDGYHWQPIACAKKS